MLFDGAIKLTHYPELGGVLVCVAAGFSPACAALKGGATLETRTRPGIAPHRQSFVGENSVAIHTNLREGLPHLS